MSVEYCEYLPNQVLGVGGEIDIGVVLYKLDILSVVIKLRELFALGIILVVGVTVDDGVSAQILSAKVKAATKIRKVAAENGIFLILGQTEVVVVIGGLQNAVINGGVGDIEPACGIAVAGEGLVYLLYLEYANNFLIGLLFLLLFGSGGSGLFLNLGGSLYLGRRLGSGRSRLILAAAAGSRKNKYQRQKQREQSVGTISFHLSIPLFLKDFNQKTGHVRFYPQYSV